MLEDIRLCLQVRAGEVARARLASSRRVAATQALVGQPVEEALRLLPLLFPLCAQAQRSAAAGAIEQAAKVNLPVEHQKARQAILLAEVIQTHGRAAWVEGSELVACNPDIDRYAALHGATHALQRAMYPDQDAFTPGGGHLRPDSAQLHSALQTIERTIAPETAPPSIRSFDQVADWASTAVTLGPRLLDAAIRRGWQSTAANPHLCRRPSLDAAAAALDADAEFSARPTLDGHPVEVGPVAALRDHPQVQPIISALGAGLAARHWARAVAVRLALEELTALTKGLRSAPPTVISLDAARAGRGQALTARGPLMHLVAWADGIVTQWRRIAPTEWTLHPDGVATRGLIGVPDEQVELRARFHLHALDPCVPFSVEVERDALSPC